MSAATSTPRTRTGCQNCRLRHLKCDEQRPACTRCAKAGIECIRGYNIRFKHGANPSVANLEGSGLEKCEFGFSEDQPWLKTSENLSFIDETQELANIYDHDLAADDIALTSQELRSSTLSASDRGSRSLAVLSSITANPTPLRVESKTELSAPSLDSLTKRRRTRPSFTLDRSFTGSSNDCPAHHELSHVFQQSPNIERIQSTSSQFGTSDPHQGSIRDLDILSNVPSAQNDVTPNFSDDFSRVYIDAPVFPLPREEAALLRYFVDRLSESFDIIDSEQHFRLIVPQRAAFCPPLLNACLAAAARHQSRVRNADPLVADKYHQECLKHLIPMLNDTTAMMDENLLASTVILRYLEEIDVPIYGTDNTSHLLGNHVFIAAQERLTVMGGLRKAAFWVGLRQEVYIAFVNQRSIAPNLEHCNIDRSFSPTDDCTWANRMIVHTADVLRYCYGEEESGSGNFATLWTYGEDWYACKPQTFKPIYYSDAVEDLDNQPEESIFPEIWILGNHVITALQYYYVTRLLLTAHNPKVPRIGPGRRNALAQMDEDIKADVKAVCGIAKSNNTCPPAYVTASMLIAMVGERFTSKTEQEALIWILEKTEKTHGWPTLTAQRHLKEAWGWYPPSVMNVDTGINPIA